MPPTLTRKGQNYVQGGGREIENFDIMLLIGKESRIGLFWVQEWLPEHPQEPRESTLAYNLSI